MQTTKQFRKALDVAYSGLIDQPGDSLALFDRVSEGLVFARELVEKLTVERDAVIADLYADAGSLQAVVDELGGRLSRARVQQLVERGRDS